MTGSAKQEILEAVRPRYLKASKAENRSLLLDAQDLSELAEVVDQRMWYYNSERRHSSIGYLSPLAYIELTRSGQDGKTNEEPQ